MEKRPRADALGHISMCLPQNPINLFANNAQEQLSWSFQCNIHQGLILKGSGIRQEQYISLPDKYIYIYICKTQIDVQSLINVQSSNRGPILKYMVVFHFLKSTFNYVTDVYTSNDVTPVRTWFWNNDGEGTRPDSEYIVFLL